jgi:hypothetical protein
MTGSLSSPQRARALQKGCALACVLFLAVSMAPPELLIISTAPIVTRLKIHSPPFSSWS